MSVNNKVYDFESIKINLPMGQMVLVEDINYKDKKDDEVITDMYGMPVGVGRGAYSGDCSLTLARSEYQKIEEEAKKKGGFYNLGNVEIVVSYGHEGQELQEDVVVVWFNEREFGGKKGDKNLNIPLKGLIVAPIKTNGVAAYTVK